MTRAQRSLYDRWAEKVEKTDSCWLWRGAMSGGGYGQLRSGEGRGRVKAHRLAYEFFVGPIPEELDVLHVCHVPACCNPRHLRLGTAKDNAADMVAADRESRPSAKLTVAEVLAIRADPRLLREIAPDYGVGIECVSKIKLHKTWKKVP